MAELEASGVRTPSISTPSRPQQQQQAYEAPMGTEGLLPAACNSRIASLPAPAALQRNGGRNDAVTGVYSVTVAP